MEENEDPTARTLRVIRREWQQEVWNDCRAAVIAELDGEVRDAMLRQLSDIAKTRGLAS